MQIKRAAAPEISGPRPFCVKIDICTEDFRRKFEMGAEHSVAALQRRAVLHGCSRCRDFLCASFLPPFVRFAQNSSVRGPSYEAPRLGLRQIALGRTDESTSHMKIHLLLKKPRPSVLLHRPAPYTCPSHEHQPRKVRRTGCDFWECSGSSWRRYASKGAKSPFV